VATQNWDAVAQYNLFLQKYAEFYREPKSIAGVAVVVDTKVSDIAFLDALAARNLIFDVVFEEDATSEYLGRYRIVIAAPSVAVHSGWKRYEDVMPSEFAVTLGQRDRSGFCCGEFPRTVSKWSHLGPLIELCRCSGFRYRSESEGAVRNRTPAFSGHRAAANFRALRRAIHVCPNTGVADI
jgi:hypothetical protein